jgi:hypothetical protein
MVHFGQCDKCDAEVDPMKLILTRLRGEKSWAYYKRSIMCKMLSSGTCSKRSLAVMYCVLLAFVAGQSVLGPGLGHAYITVSVPKGLF